MTKKPKRSSTCNAFAKNRRTKSHIRSRKPRMLPETMTIIRGCERYFNIRDMEFASIERRVQRIEAESGRAMPVRSANQRAWHVWLGTRHLGFLYVPL